MLDRPHWPCALPQSYRTHYIGEPPACNPMPRICKKRSCVPAALTVRCTARNCARFPPPVPCCRRRHQRRAVRRGLPGIAEQNEPRKCDKFNEGAECSGPGKTNRKEFWQNEPRIFNDYKVRVQFTRLPLIASCA